MSNPRTICSQINRLLASLVEVGLSDDQNCAFERTMRDGIVEVTFPQSDQVSIALKSYRSYTEIYEYLVTERAYIAKFPDGALLLIRYLYSGNELQRHSLGFYPSPNLEEFQNNPEIYLEDVVYADVIARNIVPFPIRFDFDCREEVCVPLKHPKSHLTLGQYQNCRIPLTAPLTPYWFISFLLRNFYNTAYEEYSDRLPLFREVFSDSIHVSERSLIHVQVPLTFP